MLQVRQGHLLLNQLIQPKYGALVFITYRNIELNPFQPALFRLLKVHSLRHEYTSMYLAPDLRWILDCIGCLFILVNARPKVFLVAI
jgi:hypothetical protein